MTDHSDRPIGELRHRQALLDRLLVSEGAGHVVHDLPLRGDGRAVSLESRPWRLDPIPYVIEADEFAWLEAAIAERMRAAEAILADVYGSRSLVAERVIAPGELWATARYRMSAMDSSPSRWLTTYAIDIARDTDGRWHAVQELTDAPPGLGYALMNRAVTDAVDGHRLHASPRSLAPALATLRRGLAQTVSKPGPRVVTFTGGIDHASYVEHSYLATQLGFNLVEGPDLVVRQRRLWLRTLAGLEPIDVLHRRLEDEMVDPLEVGTFGAVGVPSVLLPGRAGNLAIANGYGSGLIEAPGLSSIWDAAAEALNGRAPELALRAGGSTSGLPAGLDRWIGATAERVARLDGDHLTSAPVVLRMHAIATDEGITVVPGGSGRVLGEGDDPRIPTPCVAKDLWILGHAEPFVVTAPTAPQVDLIASVPTRAADSLYWLGRAAERAEALARVLRVVVPASLENPGIDSMLFDLLDSVRTDDLSDSDQRDFAASVDSAGPELARHVGDILAETSSVREFLSSTTGRVLGGMVDVRFVLQQAPPEIATIDDLLLQLSAFAGLWNESVVRGPAWYFGDFGRRYERSVTTLSTVAFALRSATNGQLDPHTRAQALELALSANDSLVAYRRRHRSDVALTDVLALLVADERNPRSVAASLVAMQDDAARIGWEEGRAGLAAVSSDLMARTDHDGVLQAIGRVHALAGTLTATHLVVPPYPTSMGWFT